MLIKFLFFIFADAECAILGNAFYMRIGQQASLTTGDTLTLQAGVIKELATPDNLATYADASFTVPSLDVSFSVLLYYN